MKYYSYNDIDEQGKPYIATKSEDEIRKEYFPYWSERMVEAGLQDQVTIQDCLDDWIVVNWAWESTNE